MVDGMEFAPILKDEHLICQILCALVDRENDLGPLGRVVLGDLEYFAAWRGVRAMATAEPHFIFAHILFPIDAEADIREGRGKTD